MPESALQLIEEAWNGYPYCKTVMTVCKKKTISTKTPFLLSLNSIPSLSLFHIQKRIHSWERNLSLWLSRTTFLMRVCKKTPWDWMARSWKAGRQCCWTLRRRRLTPRTTRRKLIPRCITQRKQGVVLSTLVGWWAKFSFVVLFVAVSPWTSWFFFFYYLGPENGWPCDVLLQIGDDEIQSFWLWEYCG